MNSLNEPQTAQPVSEDPRQLTGLQFVERLVAGSFNPPPMAKLLPFTLLPPAPGRIELNATPDERVLNLTKTVHAGWIMTMLDTAMWLAAFTTLGPGEVAPTHETSAKFVRPIGADAGPLRVVGQVLSRGRTVITLEAKIEDMNGRVFAHGTSTCLIARLGA